MNLLNLLLGSMSSDDSVNALSSKTGASAMQMMKLVKLALPLIIKYLTKNASSAQGAQSLLGALMQHKSTRSMPEQIGEADADDGGKILKHIFGDDEEQVVADLAEKTELDKGIVNNALASMAPGLMSGLSAASEQASAAKTASGFDFTDLAGLFGAAQQQKPAGLGGLLGGLFGGQGGGLFGGGGTDLDGDGKPDSTTDGSDLLSSLFSFIK